MKYLLLLAFLLNFSIQAMDSEPEIPKKHFLLMVKPLNANTSEVVFNWGDIQLKLLTPIKTSEAFNLNLQLDNILQALENDMLEKLREEALTFIKEKNTFIDVPADEQDPSKESPYYQDHLNKIKKDTLYAMGEIHLTILEKELEFLEYLKFYSFIEKALYQNSYVELNKRTEEMIQNINSQLKELNPREKNLFEFTFNEDLFEDEEEFEPIERISDPIETIEIKEEVKSIPEAPSKLKEAFSRQKAYILSLKEAFSRQKTAGVESEPSSVLSLRDKIAHSKELAYVSSAATSTLAFGSRTFQNIRSFWKKPTPSTESADS